MNDFQIEDRRRARDDVIGDIRCSRWHGTGPRDSHDDRDVSLLLREAEGQVELEQSGPLAGSFGHQEQRRRPIPSSSLSRTPPGDVARARLLEEAAEELLRRADRGECVRSIAII